MGRGSVRRLLALGLWCLSYVLGDETQRRHGWLWMVGFEASALGHSAGSAKIDSLLSGLYLNAEYVHHDVWKIAGEFVLGAGGALQYRGENLPIISAPNTEPARKGSVLIAFNGNFKAGYNLHAKAQKWDSPLYLNIVWRSDQLLAGQADGIFNTLTSPHSFYLELEASPRIAAKTYLEYSVAAGYTIGFVDFVRVSNAQTYRAAFKSGGLYLGGHVGISYAIRDDVRFFTRLHARRHSLGDSRAVFVPADTGDEHLTTDANVYYPKNSTYYAGVQFGFVF